VPASQALAWGLVNRVVEADALAGAVDELLAALSRCAPGAVRLQKELIIRWRETDLPSAVQAGVNAFATAYAGAEPREGAEAFLAKRAPRFGPPV
jgi:enoyl-CoA hydratase/carnithine racemase